LKKEVASFIHGIYSGCQHVTVELRHCHIKQQYIFLQKCGINFNQTNDAEVETEITISEDYCGQVKAGVPLHGYALYDIDDVTYDVQTLGKVMDKKLPSDTSEEEEEEEGEEEEKGEGEGEEEDDKGKSEHPETCVSTGGQ
jgi:hypothetical protein